MYAVVPLKEFAHAKQRLSGILNAAERQGLMRAMVSDVLSALTRTAGLDGILLVSREPQAIDVARAFGVELYVEPPRADLSEAVQAAGGFLMARHRATGTVIVPADVPLAASQDFECVLALHRELTLVPDSDGDGTNCIVSSPPNLIRYQFDGHSFRPHLDAAYAIGLTPGICRLPNLGLDIDTVADLARLLAITRVPGRAPATTLFIAQTGIASRVGQPETGMSGGKAAGQEA
jgi:2-phospho-L-lactate/phosphoenolpyruvate guanylyltransferase